MTNGEYEKKSRNINSCNLQHIKYMLWHLHNDTGTDANKMHSNEIIEQCVTWGKSSRRTALWRECNKGKLTGRDRGVETGVLMTIFKAHSQTLL